jgi:hypothetical protein
MQTGGSVKSLDVADLVSETNIICGQWVRNPRQASSINEWTHPNDIVWYRSPLLDTETAFHIISTFVPNKLSVEQGIGHTTIIATNYAIPCHAMPCKSLRRKVLYLETNNVQNYGIRNA